MKISILLLKPLTREIRAPSLHSPHALVDGPWRASVTPLAQAEFKTETLPAGAIIKADMDDPFSKWAMVVIDGWPAAGKLKKGADFQILR